MTIDVQSEKQKQKSCHWSAEFECVNPSCDEELISALDSVVWRIPGSTWWCDTNPEGDKHTPTRYWLRVPHIDNSHIGLSPLTDSGRAEQGRYFLAKLTVLRHSQQVTLCGVLLRPRSHQELYIETVGIVAGTHWKVYWSDCKYPVQLIQTSALGSCSVRQVGKEPLQLGPGVQFSGWVSGHWYGNVKPDLKTHISHTPTPGSITYSWCFLVPVFMDRLNQLVVHLLPPEANDKPLIPPPQCDNTASVRAQARRYDRHVYDRQVNSTNANGTPRTTDRSYSTTHHQLISDYSVQTTRTSKFTEKSSKQDTVCLDSRNEFVDVNSLTRNTATVHSKDSKPTILPLIPLLEPDSRLVMRVDEKCSHVEHPCTDRVPNQTKADYAHLRVTPCTDDSSVRTSHDRPQPCTSSSSSPTAAKARTLRNTSSDLGFDRSSHYYTYIRTLDGKPAHVNGAIRHSLTDDEQYSHPHLRKMSREKVNPEQQRDAKVGVVSHSMNGTYSDPVQRTSDVNVPDKCTRKTISKTYLLKELDIVTDLNETTSAPPPWMLKLNQTTKKCLSEYTPRRPSSERSWNTVGTMESIGSQCSLSPNPNEGGYFKRLTGNQSGSSSTCADDDDDDFMENTTDHLQPKRGAILSELLAELHAFAEYVIFQSPLRTDADSSNTNSGDSANATCSGRGNTVKAKSASSTTTAELRLKKEYDIQVVERRKRILSHLTTLCDEDEEEDDDDDDDDDDEVARSETPEAEYVMDHPDPADRLWSTRRSTRSQRQQQHRTTSTSGTSAICVPLPKAYRITSPMRLLTCYFQMLSDLADLQTAERKKRLSEGKYQSDLIDLSAAFLRVLATSPPPSTDSRNPQSNRAAERSKCVFGLYLLHQLGVLLGFAPWPTGETKGPRSLALVSPIRAWFPYTKQIELALGEHRDWLVRIMSREFADERKTNSDTSSIITIQSWTEYSPLLSSYRQKLVWHLSEGVQDVAWLKKIQHSPSGLLHQEPGAGDKHTDQSDTTGTIDWNAPHDIDRSQEILSWDWFVDCCQLEVQTWQKYLDSGLHTIPPVSTGPMARDLDKIIRREKNSVSENVRFPVKQWFRDEIAKWRQMKSFIRDNCSDLPVMAQILDYGQTVARHNLMEAKRRLIPTLIHDLEQIHKHTLDQFTLLELCDHLVHLPDGIHYLVECLHDISNQLHELEQKPLELQPSSGSFSSTTEVVQKLSATNELLTRWKLQLRQLQHCFCLELSFLRSVHTRHSSDSPEWIDSWTTRLMDAYHNLVQRATILRSHLQKQWLLLAFDEWISCAEPWVERISPLLRNSDELQLTNEPMFTAAWILLYDAEMLQQAYWRANREWLAIGKSLLPQPPTEFGTYLTTIRHYVDRVINNCERDPDQIVSLLHSLEQSPRDRSFIRIPELIDRVLFGQVDCSTCPDKLHALVHALRSYQRVWERRMRLTQRAIDVATNPVFARSRHGRFVRTWITSVSLRRDWQGKIICALERLARVGEVVELERFPIRPLTTFKSRFVREDLLRQEQTFIEAIHHALELHPIESSVIRTGLSVCDSHSAGSPSGSSLRGTLEELTHLYTRMIHDPLLGQTSGTEAAQDKFTHFLQRRLRDTEGFWRFLRLSAHVDWIVGPSIVNEHTKIKPSSLGDWVNRVADQFHLGEEITQYRINRVRVLSRDLNAYCDKNERPRFTHCMTGFSWTKISIDMEAIDLFRQIHSTHRDTLLPPGLPTTEAIQKCIQTNLAVMEKKPVSQSISSVHARNCIPSACHVHGTPDAIQCLTEWTNLLRTIESELTKPKQQGQSELIYLERILIRLVKIRTRLSPNNPEFISEDRRLPTVTDWIRLLSVLVGQLRSAWDDLIHDPDAHIELTAFLRRWFKQLSPRVAGIPNQLEDPRSGTANGISLDNNASSDEDETVDFSRDVQVFHILLESLCDVLRAEQNRGNRSDLPQWLDRTRDEIDRLLMWLPVTDLITESSCARCQMTQLHLLLDMYEIEAEKNFRSHATPVGSNLASQLNILSNCLQLYLRNKTEASADGTNSMPPMWRALVDRIESIRARVDVVQQANRVFRQLHHFTTELLEQTELIEPRNPVHIEELQAALTALKNALYSVKPDPQLATCPVSMTHQFWTRQLNLVQKLIPSCNSWESNRVTPGLSERSSITVRHEMNQILAEVNHIQHTLMETLIRGLNTHVSGCALVADSDHSPAPRISYDLCVKLPSDPDLAHMYTQLSHLNRRCDEALMLINSDRHDGAAIGDPGAHGDEDEQIEADNTIGLIAQPVDMRSEDPSVEYALGLLKQLQTGVKSSSTELRLRVNYAVDQADKIQELIGALSEHVNESAVIEHRIYSALPNLTGRFMDELAKAVDELEVHWAQSRMESPVPLKTQSQIADQLKHAGQRLMELETSLEHACECTRVLLLLSIGDRLWTNQTELRLSVAERGAILQADYEHSFGHAQLREAWARLAQIGDRLGRIQAGLPVRQTADNNISAWTVEQTKVNTDGQRNSSETNQSESPDIIRDHPDDHAPPSPPTGQTEHAELVRQKRLKLRDLLGSHVCVYPECKQAQNEWLDFAMEISNEQITIVEKIRKVFVEIVHFYAQLKKDLIEARGPNSRQSVTQAIRQDTWLSLLSPSSFTCSPADGVPTSHSHFTHPTDWHQDAELSGKYWNLMTRVQRLSECELPQIKKLLDKAQSLEALWNAQRLSTDDLRNVNGSPTEEDVMMMMSPHSCVTSSPTTSTIYCDNYGSRKCLQDDKVKVHSLDEIGAKMLNEKQDYVATISLGSSAASSPRIIDEELSMLHGIARNHFERLFSDELKGLDSSQTNHGDTDLCGIEKPDLTANMGEQTNPVSAVDAMNAARKAQALKSQRARQKREAKRRKGKVQSATAAKVPTEVQEPMPIESSPIRTVSPLTGKSGKQFRDNGSPKPTASMKADSGNLIQKRGTRSKMNRTTKRPDLMSPDKSDRKDYVDEKQQLCDPFPSVMTCGRLKEAPLAQSSPREPIWIEPINIHERGLPLGRREHMELLRRINGAMETLEEHTPIQISQVSPKLSSHKTLLQNPVVSNRDDSDKTANPTERKSSFLLFEADHQVQLMDETADTDPSWITVQPKPSRKSKKKTANRKSKKTKTKCPELQEEQQTQQKQQQEQEQQPQEQKPLHRQQTRLRDNEVENDLSGSIPGHNGNAIPNASEESKIDPYLKASQVSGLTADAPQLDKLETHESEKTFTLNENLTVIQPTEGKHFAALDLINPLIEKKFNQSTILSPVVNDMKSNLRGGLAENVYNLTQSSSKELKTKQATFPDQPNCKKDGGQQPAFHDAQTTVQTADTSLQSKQTTYVSEQSNSSQDRKQLSQASYPEYYSKSGVCLSPYSSELTGTQPIIPSSIVPVRDKSSQGDIDQSEKRGKDPIASQTSISDHSNLTSVTLEPPTLSLFPISADTLAGGHNLIPKQISPGERNHAKEVTSDYSLSVQELKVDNHFIEHTLSSALKPTDQLAEHEDNSIPLENHKVFPTNVYKPVVRELGPPKSSMSAVIEQCLPLGSISSQDVLQSSAFSEDSGKIGFLQTVSIVEDTSLGVSVGEKPKEKGNKNEIEGRQISEFVGLGEIQQITRNYPAKGSVRVFDSSAGSSVMSRDKVTSGTPEPVEESSVSNQSAENFQEINEPSGFSGDVRFRHLELPRPSTASLRDTSSLSSSTVVLGQEAHSSTGLRAKSSETATGIYPVQPAVTLTDSKLFTPVTSTECANTNNELRLVPGNAETEIYRDQSKQTLSDSRDTDLTKAPADDVLNQLFIEISSEFEPERHTPDHLVVKAEHGENNGTIETDSKQAVDTTDDNRKSKSATVNMSKVDLHPDERDLSESQDTDYEDEDMKIPTLFEELSISPDDISLAKDDEYCRLTDLDDPSLRSVRVTLPTRRSDRIHLHPIIEQPSDQSTFEDECINGLIDEFPHEGDTSPSSNIIVSTEELTPTFSDERTPVSTGQVLESSSSISYIGTRKIRKARRRLLPGQTSSPSDLAGCKTTDPGDSDIGPASDVTSSDQSGSLGSVQLPNMSELGSTKIGESKEGANAESHRVPGVPHPTLPSAQHLTEPKSENQPLNPLNWETSWEEICNLSSSQESEHRAVVKAIPNDRVSLAVYSTAFSYTKATSVNLSPSSYVKLSNRSTVDDSNLDHTSLQHVSTNDASKQPSEKSIRNVDRAVRFADLPTKHNKKEVTGHLNAIRTTPATPSSGKSGRTKSMHTTEQSDQLLKEEDGIPVGKVIEEAIKKQRKGRTEPHLSSGLSPRPTDRSHHMESKVKKSKSRVHASAMIATPHSMLTESTLNGRDETADRTENRQSYLRQSEPTRNRSTQTSSEDYSVGKIIFVKHETDVCERKIHLGSGSSPQKPGQSMEDDESQTTWTILNSRTNKASQTEPFLLRDRWTVSAENWTGEDEQMVCEAQQKWLKKTRANDENSQRILAAERRLSESKDSSCWHRLCPFLGLLLLLLLPLLLLACLFLIPECESQYLWTRCAENSIIWRYFYNPLRLVRGERRPPL